MRKNDPARVAAAKAALLDFALPDICLEEDIARAFRLTLPEARRLIAEEAIPGRWMRGRWATTRDAVMQYIAPRSEPMA